MPKGEAEKELQKKAEDLFRSDHAHLTEEEQNAALSQHAKQLSGFHDVVRNRHDRWRSVNDFHSLHDLRELAIVTCFIWDRNLFHAAQSGATDHHSRVPTDAELGALGRGLQVAAAKKAVARLDALPDVPGITLLVHGDEESGQGEFCTHLLTLKPFQRGHQARGRPALVRYDLPTFVSWCGQALGVAPAEQSVDTIEDLALRLRPVLENRRVTLFVDHVERFPGGVVGYQSAFWKPLLDALRTLSLEQANVHRLVVIAAEYTGQSDPWERATRMQHEPGDPALLVRLPPLESFTDADVLEWLGELEVLDHGPGHRAVVMEIAMNSPSGEWDGTPLRVFNRLKEPTLWPER
jgi:hypothetical protein